MISTRPALQRITEENFEQSLAVINRSRVVEMLEEFRGEAGRGGGRPVSGVEFTMKAYLVGALATLRSGRVPSTAEVCRVIATMTPAQRAEVGMDPDSDVDVERDYKRLVNWLHR